MKIRVIWPGKTKKPYYKDAIQDYASRIGKLCAFEIIETKDESLTDRAFKKRIATESKALAKKTEGRTTVVLDTDGKQLSSEQFADWLNSAHSEIDFVVGGPHGVDLAGSKLLLSLGKFTLPHELARVVLLEQIYRALTISKGIPYHK